MKKIQFTKRRYSVAFIIVLLLFGTAACKKTQEQPGITQTTEISFLQQAKQFTAANLSPAELSQLDFSRAVVYKHDEKPVLAKVPGQGYENLYLRMNEEGFTGAWATLRQEYGQIVEINSQSLNREQEVVVAIRQGRMQSVSVVKGNISPVLPGNPQQRVLAGPFLVVNLDFGQLVLMQVLGIGQPGWYNSSGGGNSNDLDYILNGEQSGGGGNETPILMYFQDEQELQGYIHWVETELTQAELALVVQHPVESLFVYRNANFALAKAQTYFPNSSANDGQGDAFRHALWNAKNARSIGVYLATLFATAHEENTPPANPVDLQIFNARRSMDLFNNQIGISIFLADGPYVSDEVYIARILERINQGHLRIICWLTINGIPTLQSISPSNVIC
jgi:hypothetical protein